MPDSLNGSTNGSGHSLPKDEDDDSSGVPPPENVVELAASCVRFVASRYNVALDFAPDTLPVVDQYIRDARKELSVRPESVPLLTASIGAYVGEVMRQRFGGFWFSEGDYSGWRLYFTRVYLACNPLGMMLEAIAPEEAEGWHAHFEIDPGDSEVVASRLAVFPEVDAEIFSLPSTRLEALTVVYEALRAHMEQNNTGDVRFGPDDYK